MPKTYRPGSADGPPIIKRVYRFICPLRHRLRGSGLAQRLLDADDLHIAVELSTASPILFDGPLLDL
jgi:hypothetical protein